MKKDTPPLLSTFSETISGENKVGSIALKNNKKLKKVALHLHSAFVGLINLPGGSLDIGELIIDAIGGDSINIRHGDIFIERLVVIGAKAWIEYEYYHQDICQSYAVEDDGYTLDPDGVVRRVYIAHVDIEVYDPKHQIFMLSDGHFAEWHIGYKSLRIRCLYPFWFVANTLERSFIGNLDNVDIAFLYKVMAGKPKVRIGDGIEGSPFCIKKSKHRTGQVQIIGCGKDNVVPSLVGQF